MGAALLAVLGACTSTGDPAPDAVASARLSMTASPTSASLPPSAEPAPSMLGTATLSPAQLQAFEEATATVLAYRQTIVDLYSGTRTNLNDLNLVAAGEMLEQNLQQIRDGLDAGRHVEPVGARIDLVSASPQRDIPAGQVDGAVIVVEACFDARGATTIEGDGTITGGVVESLFYTLHLASGAKNSGWRVTRVTGASEPGARSC